VRDAVKKAGFPVPRTEGEGNGEWIIIDCGAAVVHVMQPTIRDYYHLEEIWGDKPVNIKLAGAVVKLVKAEEPQAPAKKAAAKKAAAKAPAAKKSAAAKAPTKVAAKAPVKAAAKKVAAKVPVVRKMLVVGKPPAKKPAPAGRSGVTRTVGVKTAAAKKAPARTAAAKKSPARKTAAR
jgi:ribosome-associated protein